jgi:hypothetical protein
VFDRVVSFDGFSHLKFTFSDEVDTFDLAFTFFVDGTTAGIFNFLHVLEYLGNGVRSEILKNAIVFHLLNNLLQLAPVFFANHLHVVKT